METTIMTRQPAADEYAPYYKTYVDAVQTDDIVAYLEQQKTAELDFLRGIKWEKWELAYAPDKWTLAEVVIHAIDTERIFAYRALRIARGDKTPLPGFDQGPYVPNSGAASRTPASIADEFAAVREATIHLFKNFTDDMWNRRGTAADNEVSTLALAFMIGGHTAHHLKVIRERYLANGG
ncbi:MAG: DinB family protein [Thermoanaerobaculia bacterium]|nr:DinB family protein [Thermoanaerobaculia bacterium]